MDATTDTPLNDAERRSRGYHHAAFFYEGMEQFLTGTLEFLSEAIEHEEPALAVLPIAKMGALRDGLGVLGDAVFFADMDDVGHNPARIICAWQDFVNAHATPNIRVHGIGEPIFPDRTPAQMLECHRHEGLLNLAFGQIDFHLLCPYDAMNLEPGVLEQARRTHPLIYEGGQDRSNEIYPGDDAQGAPVMTPLPSASGPVNEISFYLAEDMLAVRSFVEQRARSAGLNDLQVADLVLAANEIATNSLSHGGGHGTLRSWKEADSLICEIVDSGRITDPLVGRFRPDVFTTSGRGFWLANQLCDLVQLRTVDSGNVVRLHMYLRTS